uniref:ATP synthase complex subunit 8 n=1 Tax=Parochlus steinenii TaxID=315571 RepID=A0A0H4SQT6_9DIPT|nr:ATP synthase F0 subunit 8 [Parochlus steinenii]AKP94956.1 ATP synthase F0 subunit 8 [Parochlus steinenii]
MPQMAPISWLFLFGIFSITLIMFNIMNYYSFLPKTPNIEKMNQSFKSTSLNWKW